MEIGVLIVAALVGSLSGAIVLRMFASNKDFLEVFDLRTAILTTALFPVWMIFFRISLG